jgi:beta propeller repeat protein
VKCRTALTVFVSVIVPSCPIQAATWPEYRITTSPAYQQNPSIDGHIVVWQDERHSTSDIYAADISDINNPTEFVISSQPYEEFRPLVSGDLVYYGCYGTGCTTGYSKRNIYEYNLDTQITSQITNYDCISKNSPFVLGGNDGFTVVWTLGNQIRAYDIVTDSLFQVSSLQNTSVFNRADVSGSFIIWNEERNSNWDIYGFDILTWQKFRITTNSERQFAPRIYNNIVVWQDWRNGNEDIYGADITDPCNPIEFEICTDINSQNYPAISGNIVVWQDYRNGNDDIYGYDILTETEFQITDNTAEQRNPDISGHTVVWEDYRNGQPDIYATILYGAQVPKCLSPLQGDLNNDCKVDFADFAILTTNWLECNLDPPEACW